MSKWREQTVDNYKIIRNEVNQMIRNDRNNYQKKINSEFQELPKKILRIYEEYSDC